MKKAIFVLDINYDKRITDLTYPLIKEYARKIEAELIIINRRRFSSWPVECEKFQIYDYKDQYDWYFYIDLDALIHPDTPDFTELIPEDEVFFAVAQTCISFFKLDDNFRRDGRFIDAGNWFNLCSNLTIDLWNPDFDYIPVEVESRINLLERDKKAGITNRHLADEFLVSNNIAKYGLKLEILSDVLNKLNLQNDIYFDHKDRLLDKKGGSHPITNLQKVKMLRRTLKRWGL